MYKWNISSTSWSFRGSPRLSLYFPTCLCSFVHSRDSKGRTCRSHLFRKLWDNLSHSPAPCAIYLNSLSQSLASFKVDHIFLTRPTCQASGSGRSCCKGRKVQRLLFWSLGLVEGAASRAECPNRKGSQYFDGKDQEERRPSKLVNGDGEMATIHCLPLSNYPLQLEKEKLQTFQAHKLPLILNWISGLAMPIVSRTCFQ